MLVSLNWIKEYVDLPDGVDGDAIAHALTLSTVEVESAERLSDRFDRIRTGRVRAISRHPKADRLTLVDVELGTDDVRRVVCGGINLFAGQIVALAEPGSFVRWHGQGEPVEIQATVLRGESSDGMICASSELGLEGLFPQTSEAEILDLTALAPEIGRPLADALGLNDVLFEIDNKSLTNRPDLWGHYGIARELAAIYEVPLKPLTEVTLPDLPSGFPVDLPDPACRRYAALSLESIRVEPSPAWLRVALWKVGVRPMNVPVDITNYVMLAIGQPTHAFDADRLDSVIRVRRADPGERLALLNGETLSLHGEDLLITDAKGPLGMAGIMGGEDDSVHADTSRIVLEIANFDPVVIRRSAQRHGLRTEASARFEKSLDTQRVDLALALSADLFLRLIPGCRISALTDARRTETPALAITVELAFLQTRLGRSLEASDARSSLERLGFAVSEADRVLTVSVPSWRDTGDVEQRDDVLEEIARIIGYENFPYQPPQVALVSAPKVSRYRLFRHIRETMAVRFGMQEIFTYPWIDDSYAVLAGSADTLTLANPPAPERSRLRASLIPGLLESVAANLRWLDSFQIFELTQVFDAARTDANEKGERLPVTRHHLGAALVGDDGWQLFRQAKGMLETLSRYAQFAPLRFEPGREPWADPAVCLHIDLDGKTIGTLGLLSLQAARRADIKFASVVLFELDADALNALPSRDNRFEPLPAIPLVPEDLSVIVEDAVSWHDIAAVVSPLVRRLVFIDEYRGAQIGSGKKSVTFRFWLEAEEGTLTAEAIEKRMKKVMDSLTHRLGGEFRGV